jgi:VWFA-related protein
MQTPVERVREQRGGAAICGGCEETSAAVTGKARLLPDPDSRATPARWADSGWIFHSSVDEVAFMFAATDHGKAISDLTLADTTIRDGGKPPAAVTGFKGEAQLPLRLGLIIDTSESITTRFSFEQAVADDFMRRVVTGKEDLALVVGFSNSVLLVQDFTDDGHRISEAINKLAPAGGTALWDAVAFAADKLARRAEDQPVARMLVVITDGGDNSSRASLKRAIEAAEVGGVTIYAVSTQENRDLDTPSLKDSAAVSAHALRTLAEATGGKAFFPGSIHNMNRSLGDLQEVIRSRYFVSYKPALFKRDGRYRAIDITAHKFGHKLRTYVRKGYYAR